jgi:hypothetical protein
MPEQSNPGAAAACLSTMILGLGMWVRMRRDTTFLVMTAPLT